jgi:hypothetical protein
VAIIRGICRQIDWYGKKCYNDGLAAATPASPTDDFARKEGIDDL